VLFQTTSTIRRSKAFPLQLVKVACLQEDQEGSRYSGRVDGDLSRQYLLITIFSYRLQSGDASCQLELVEGVADNEP
jgi:hypothetical protein